MHVCDDRRWRFERPGRLVRRGRGYFMLRLVTAGAARHSACAPKLAVEMIAMRAVRPAIYINARHFIGVITLVGQAFTDMSRRCGRKFTAAMPRDGRLSCRRRRTYAMPLPAARRARHGRRLQRRTPAPALGHAGVEIGNRATPPIIHGA